MWVLIIKDHQIFGIDIPKNGYIYVYCNNESNHDVFFDNLQLMHNKGAILEACPPTIKVLRKWRETHYYPFGLTMAGISSKAANMTPNRRKFNNGREIQSEEFSDGSGLCFLETDARTYDYQIGRFIQINPLADINENYTGYVYTNNNPISFNDPSGLAEEPGNGNPGNGTKVHEEVVVRTDAYRKKRYDYLNSIDFHQWAVIVSGLRKNYGYTDAMIKERYEYINYSASKQLEKGMMYDQMSTHKDASTRQGDKIAIGIASNFIPVGRIANWSIKGVGIVVKAYQKASPIVRSLAAKAVKNYGAGFVEETSKELIANRGNPLKVDWFDVASTTVANTHTKNVFIKGAVEIGNAFIDIDGKDGITTIGYGKGNGEIFIDATRGYFKTMSNVFTTAGVSTPIANELVGLAVDQAATSIKLKTAKD